MSDPLTVWRARCFLQECRARDDVRRFQTIEQAHPWALDHAHNRARGGHVVCVWGDDRPGFAHLLRYCHPSHPVRDWVPGWGWCCLTCPPGPLLRPVWNEGSPTREDVLADWRDHPCTRGRTS